MMAKHNLDKDNTVFLTVGKTGTEFFKKRGMNVVYEYSGVSDVPTYREVHSIVKTAVQMYSDQVFDEMYMVYSHYVNRITSNVIVHDVLPITEKSLLDDENEAQENTELNNSDVSTNNKLIITVNYYGKSQTKSITIN